MPGRFDRLAWIGPVAVFLAACAFSTLDTEYASDTWIGLASGRHIICRHYLLASTLLNRERIAAGNHE